VASSSIARSNAAIAFSVFVKVNAMPACTWAGASAGQWVTSAPAQARDSSSSSSCQATFDRVKKFMKSGDSE
jgi:hypothetical protein